MTAGGATLLALAVCLVSGPQPCGDRYQPRRVAASPVDREAHLLELLRRHYALAHAATLREPLPISCAGRTAGLTAGPGAGERVTNVNGGQP
jgi:hypothetical protein